MCYLEFQATGGAGSTVWTVTGFLLARDAHEDGSARQRCGATSTFGGGAGVCRLTSL